MAKVQKPCKTCGKMFTPCADCERDKNMFHWRTVACSIECAKAYFEKVELARKPVAKVEEARNHVVNTKIKNEETKSEETENIVSEEIIKEEVSKPKRIRKQNNFENEKESE